MRKLKICADPFPPYQYIDKDGCVKGRDYELVAGRLHKAGYETEVCIALTVYRMMTTLEEIGVIERRCVFRVRDEVEL